VAYAEGSVPLPPNLPLRSTLARQKQQGDSLFSSSLRAEDGLSSLAVARPS
jgi:hypothetical protein